jgi:hypothetical protein
MINVLYKNTVFGSTMTRNYRQAMATQHLSHDQAGAAYVE